MSDISNFKKIVKDVLNGREEADRERKQSMKASIDKADNIFMFLLLLFGLGFWVVMIIQAFL